MNNYWTFSQIYWTVYYFWKTFEWITFEENLSKTDISFWICTHKLIKSFTVIWALHNFILFITFSVVIDKISSMFHLDPHIFTCMPLFLSTLQGKLNFKTIKQWNIGGNSIPYLGTNNNQNYTLEPNRSVLNPFCK